MNISSDIVIGGDPWVERLRDEARLAPFKRMLCAINSSLSGQRYEAIHAEDAMTKSAAFGGVSAGIGALVYFTGQPAFAAIFGVVSAVCAFAFARAVGKRNAYRSELELMERYLIEAGFKLAWQKGVTNTRPVILTLEWPEDGKSAT